MNRQFAHILGDSFRAWFENKLQQEGRSFRNVSGRLYQTPCEYPGKYAYSNPYGQWIYDSAVSGAYVPSGVFVNGSFVNKGTDGLILDFINGRAIFDSPQTNVTARYAVKEFNVYTTSQSDSQLVFDDKLKFRPKFNNAVTTGVPPNNTYGPLVYIKRDYLSNEPFALGGQDNTTAHYRAIVLTDNEYDLDGVGSIFADAAREYFMLLDNPPLNRINDLYTGNYYNYFQTVINNYNESNMVCVTDVDYYRFDARTETAIKHDWYAGFIEFNIEIPRFPRANTNTTLYPPETVLYYQNINLPSGIYSYDVIFENGNNLVSAEVILPSSASGIYISNLSNVSSTGFTAIFDYLYETGVILRVVTSN